MCIVIDMNTLSSVFNETTKNHSDFRPVRDWIVEGPGHVVYGGTKYKSELSRTNYLKLFKLLKDRRSAFEIDQVAVDAEHARIEQRTRKSSCDDQHIIAIFVVSGCRLFCSGDKSADKYITDKSLYRKGQTRPSIYRSKSQAHLLSRKYIVKLRHVV